MEKQDEPQEEQQEERQEPQEEEIPEDITSFRPGDTVMTIRKRIRAARKAANKLSVEEEVAQRRAEAQKHRERSYQAAQSQRDGELNPLEAREASKDPSSGRPIPRKVERFHKDLIRKEVWRQKFNYLFKRMQAGVDSELVHDRKNRRLSIQQQQGREEEDAEARRQRVVAGIQESVERELSKLRRASGPLGSPRPLARLTNQAMKSAETEVEKEVEMVETDTEATEERNAICDFEPVVTDPTPPKPMGWRRTGPLRSRAPVVQLPLQVNHAPKKPGPESSRRKRGIAGILQPSTSLPVLRTTPDLLGVRDEYYGGDELFMHEDILHTSNPRLFPLRGGHSTPFPTVKLCLPDLDSE